MSRYIEWDEDRKARYDTARAKVDEAVREILQAAYEEDFDANDPPYPQGWVLITEFTNIELEQTDAGGRYIAAPQGQTFSLGHGLCAWGMTRFEE